MNKVDTRALNLLTIIRLTAPNWGKDLTDYEIRCTFETVAGVIEAQKNLEYSRQQREIKNNEV